MNAADSSCKAGPALLKSEAWGLAHKQDSSVSSRVNLHPLLLGTGSAKGSAFTKGETVFVAEVPKLCRMEADGGPCRGHIKRYAFNLSSMRCEEFIYGGCYGNGNNFQDLQSCVDHCLPEKSNGCSKFLIN